MSRSYLLRCLFAAAFLVSLSVPLSAEVLTKNVTVSGLVVHYKVVLPNGYDPAKTYPGVLAFPGGPQTMEMVDGTLERNWHLLGERLGYIVIIPAAPDGLLFFQDGAKVFPAFLVQMLKEYKILDNKFHIAGVSNGGLSAFHLAAMYPKYFWSVTGLPGFLLDSTPERVHALSNLCINMYAGENDPEWLNSEKQQAERFRSQGLTVEFSEEKGEGHVMRTLDGEGAQRLFDQFEKARRDGCGGGK